MGQAIRPSQFILTYGVGSIIESIKGPRLIPEIRRWDYARIIFADPGNLKIIDNENIRAQLDGGDVFSMPTNPEYDLPASQALFSTKRFPSWALCIKHMILYKLGRKGKSNCPSCKFNPQDCQEEAIRFVRACPDGHLDDVDWKYTIHGDTACSGEVFDWNESAGSDIKSIRLICRLCGKDSRLIDIYRNTHHCSGIFQEEDGIVGGCDKKSSIILRNATSLRIAEVVTAITIPHSVWKIDEVLKHASIGKIILSIAEKDPDSKKKLLEFILPSPDVDDETKAEIEMTPSNEVKDAIKRALIPPNLEKKPEDVKMEEFNALVHAASFGFPINPATGPPKFEVDRSSVITYIHKNSGLEFRVTPVKRLTVVMAQKGYKRPVRGPMYDEDDDEDKSIKLTHTYYQHGNKRWYPGIELHGEGIFIDLPKKNPNLNRRKHSKSSDKDLHKDPLYMWWHSLSHRLINGLSLDSGYSSASIRERIYFNRDETNNILTGGILLYTSQHGGDGSLGGLIALAGNKEFSKVFESAERNLNSCSNDPLCSGSVAGNNGAACYACLLISETSCEIHNDYLDRRILINGLNKF